MANICYEVASDSETEQQQRQRINFISDEKKDNESKRQKTNIIISVVNPNDENNDIIGESSRSVDNNVSEKQYTNESYSVISNDENNDIVDNNVSEKHCTNDTYNSGVDKSVGIINPVPKFGVAAVCGHRRHMEDTVAIHPSLVNDPDLHYFAVYDGHGCSHVAVKCRDRLHELVKEELSSNNNELLLEWQQAMEKSFAKMDEEATTPRNQGVVAKCRCQLQTPQCNGVGSTAVVAVVTRDKIIVANCGDSRAVLSRNGRAIPLSIDHKPDRPDELTRIQEAGGIVLYWDCPRVLGMLNMSRAIGDKYLKPYVSCEPEVTITDRTSEDECLILASDGLWDVVSNDTACGVVRMCLRGNELPSGDTTESLRSAVDTVEVYGVSRTVDKACMGASVLLTKLALARNTEDNVSVVVVDLNMTKEF